MAGDSQTGGGGSVYWSIDVDNIDYKPGNTICEDHGDRRFHQRGRDRDGVAKTDRFTVSIKVPEDQAEAQRFLDLLKAADNGSQPGRVTFTLPIEKDKNQIRVTWGDRSVAARSKRVLANAHVAARPADHQSEAPKRKSNGARANRRKPSLGGRKRR